ADNYEEFQKLGVEIYSVSTDTHFSHKAPHETSDTIGTLQFPMTGDPTGETSPNFDARRPGQGVPARGTSLIDPAGTTPCTEPTGEISTYFDVLRPGQGLADRRTFLSDPEGIIQCTETTAEGIGRNATELIRKVKAAQYVAAHPGEVCPAKWEEGDSTLAPSL